MFKAKYEDIFSGNFIKTQSAYKTVLEVASTPAGFSLFSEMSGATDTRLDLQMGYVARLARMDARLQALVDSNKAQEVWAAAMRVHNKLAKADAAVQGHNNFKRLDGRGVFKDQLLLSYAPQEVSNAA